MKKYREKLNTISRREFLKDSALVSAAIGVGLNSSVFAAGSDTIRIGLIGCGGRGRAGVQECVQSSNGVEVTAIGDLFADRLNETLAEFKEKIPANIKVTSDKCFVGFDAYKKVIAGDANLIFLHTPPHYRPIHLKAAVEAGKDVFMEKPVATDPVGARSIIESSKLAKQKGLAIVAGTQRRHQAPYLEVMSRIHNGDIGEILGGQFRWLAGLVAGYWKVYEKGNLSDMELQCRNWGWYTWLSGDHIVEQHLHNIDVMNWAMGSHPVKCLGMGGREVRKLGNIFDHFAVDYEYANGVRMSSMCRQTAGCSNDVSERVVGTKGRTYTDASGNCYIEGEKPYKYDGENINPYVQEHTDLIAGIRAGKPLNEGVQAAESTLTAIMGRMSAYTGRAVQWDWVMKASKLDLSPPAYDFNIDFPPRAPAVPGQTQLV
jgi:predicted dehydrogenase